MGIDKFKTKARERFIQPDEFDRFFKAVKQEPSDTMLDYVFVSLLTAARQSTVLAMRWDQINFDLGTWYIPETKNGDSQTIPLTDAALKILQDRKDRVKDDWVFPGDGVSGHLVSPGKSFKRILARAGVSDLRLHDLRRTMGSYLAIQGTSSTIIGKALGHKSHTATAIYARLTTDPVKHALESAQAIMFEVVGLDEFLKPDAKRKSKIIRITQKKEEKKSELSSKKTRKPPKSG